MMVYDPETAVIDVASAYTRFPAGRHRTDGPYSGERFRDDLLIPAIEKHGHVTVRLDGAMGYGSSFLEEVFGGLLRSRRFGDADLRSLITLETRDRSLIDEIEEYLSPLRH
ncbi:MAG: hypothetical protein JWM75_2561 [Sphingomonas bacterium]|nr:hypothetical protein [Sphingomonas bacterium]